ncbi:uncharacterized protein LOC122539340 isoform X6 [Chiloscyllium plagiosum]|uniref:uncharacterized protein LOC122539340 isoform X6 n=1 Tax=Chiloscyllium plagiosum TaxID=36176 RepID=UPI001CB85166|nr:uncharacterized protein LOC122539340 isoform X6 [Chiloscyllium plagiosum]
MSDPEAKELTKWGLQSTLDGNAKFHRNCDWNLKIIQAFKHFPFYTNPLSGTDTNPVLEITTTKRNSRIDFIQSDLTKRIHALTSLNSKATIRGWPSLLTILALTPTWNPNHLPIPSPRPTVSIPVT